MHEVSVFGRFPEPAHMPCPECGVSVARAETETHECDRERWLDHQLFLEREQIARLAQDIEAYFTSAAGRFEAWYAERERRRRKRAGSGGE